MNHRTAYTLLYVTQNERRTRKEGATGGTKIGGGMGQDE